MNPKCLFAALVLGTAVFLGNVSQAQMTLEIPEEEFEAFENKKPIPVPDPSGGPVNQMFEFMELDMTDTLPDAVLESMLGKSPYDFVDIVWGMQFSGNWSEALEGTGVLQVTNFTEGLGASRQADPEKHTGQAGFRMYNARLDTDGEHVFRVSAAFPPDFGGEALGTELESVKGLFEVTWLCHMFEPERTGCRDYPDEYYETELPDLKRLHIAPSASGYRIEFEARVHETRSHRQRGYRSTDYTGRYADVSGWICDQASWEADPRECETSEALVVTDNAPTHLRENVDLDTPEIGMSFDRPVDPAILEQNFSVSTRDIRGEPQPMTGRVVALSESTFRFEPDYPLESGVIYEARIAGGNQGLRAQDGARMKVNAHWWRFTTLVDLENHGEPVAEPVRNRVYQTVRDAPLVVGKPAVQRIYIEWKPHEHIHKAWQAESYPAELDINVINENQWRVDPQEGGSVDGGVVRVVRTDLLEETARSPEIVRHARNTINVYGWTPDQTGGTSVLETRLTPHDPHPASSQPPQVVAESDVQHWHIDPSPLVFRYAILEVGPWADGIPDLERQRLQSVVRMAEEFIVQLMPVKKAYGIDSMRDADMNYANIHRDFLVSALAAIVQAREGVEQSRLTDFVKWIAEIRRGNPVFQGLDFNLAMNDYLTANGRDAVHLEALKNTVRAMREELGTFFSGDDVFVVFYPPEFRGPGQTFRQKLHSDGRHGIVMPITLKRSASALAEGLVHEVGHYFGLSHQPAEKSALNITPAEFEGGGFEGFRLALDGMSGFNKSSEEGNGESSVALVPLMWPYTLQRHLVFLSNEDYRTLLRAFSTRL